MWIWVDAHLGVCGRLCSFLWFRSTYEQFGQMALVSPPLRGALKLKKENYMRPVSFLIYCARVECFVAVVNMG